MRAFSKALTVSELTLTPIKRVLTKRRNKLVFRHSLKMITTKVVRMLYLGTWSTLKTIFSVTTMHVPRTRVMKRGTEKSNSYMLE